MKRTKILTKKQNLRGAIAPLFIGKVNFRKPTEIEFSSIVSFIIAYELDNRGLKKEQFLIAVYENILVGFARLREHSDCIELCSIGVVSPYRRKGIGKALVAELIKNVSKNIFLVCIIPDFFIPFGFKIINKFPVSIQEKINYCEQELVVAETYVAMAIERGGVNPSLYDRYCM